MQERVVRLPDPPYTVSSQSGNQTKERVPPETGKMCWMDGLISCYKGMTFLSLSSQSLSQIKFSFCFETLTISNTEDKVHSHRLLVCLISTVRRSILILVPGDSNPIPIKSHL